MSKKNIGKVYSRKRFLLNPSFNSIKNNYKNDSNKFKLKNNKIKKKVIKKIIKLGILICIIILIIQFLFYCFEPIFETLCEEKVKSLTTIITNQQSTYVMEKYKYEELYTIEKEPNGNIVMIKANIMPINNLISNLVENIQNEFEKIDNQIINIPIGNLSGIYIFSGSGPKIPIEISVKGTVNTDIKNEFIEQGINQTLHRVYVNFECNMKILTPFKNYDKKITNQVIIAEHIIVGNIPENYYDLDGMESDLDTLNVLN